jgi:hypothetical protein
VEPLSEIYRREADRLLWIIQSLSDTEARAELMLIARRFGTLSQHAKAHEHRPAGSARIRRAG